LCPWLVAHRTCGETEIEIEEEEEEEEEEDA
jgi:hypothetical protein